MNILIVKGVLYALVAHALTFLQFQGGIKYGLSEKYPWLLALGGIPISYLFMMSISNFIQAYGGQIWPSRLLGFGVGVIVFTAMSYFIFGETINMKTATCLLLAISIICIQVFWK